MSKPKPRYCAKCGKQCASAVEAAAHCVGKKEPKPKKEGK